MIFLLSLITLFLLLKTDEFNLDQTLSDTNSIFQTCTIHFSLLCFMKFYNQTEEVENYYIRIAIILLTAMTKIARSNMLFGDNRKNKICITATMVLMIILCFANLSISHSFSYLVLCTAIIPQIIFIVEATTTSIFISQQLKNILTFYVIMSTSLFHPAVLSFYELVFSSK